MRVNVEDTEDACEGVLHGGQPFTGEVVEVGDDGTLISLYTYYAGVQDGPYSEWYGPGRPFKEGTMKFGLLNGVNRQWHPNGQLALETEVDDQGRQLYRKEWGEDGNVTDAFPAWMDDIDHGLQVEWHPNGQKRSEGWCEQGAAVGEWREWHANGQLAEYLLLNRFGEMIRRQRWDAEGNLVEDKKSGITRGL